MRPYKSPIGRRLPDYLFLACRAPLGSLVASTGRAPLAPDAHRVRPFFFAALTFLACCLHGPRALYPLRVRIITRMAFVRTQRDASVQEPDRASPT